MSNTVTVRQLRRFLEHFESDAKVRFLGPNNEALSVSELWGVRTPNIELAPADAPVPAERA